MAFWLAYPRKVGKRPALRAWRRAVKEVDPQILPPAAAAYARAMRAQGMQAKHIKHPETWLDKAGWEDDHAVAVTPTPPAFVPEPTGGGPPPAALRDALRVRPHQAPTRPKEAIS